MDAITTRYVRPNKGDKAPIGHTDGAMAMGIPIGLDLPTIMADWYLLERLRADGSKRAAFMFRELTDHFAPLIARYMVLICGGELRHIRYQSEGGAYCDCGCGCWCGPDNDCDCYNPEQECECGGNCFSHDEHDCGYDCDTDDLEEGEETCDKYGDCNSDCTQCAWEDDPERYCCCGCFDRYCTECYWNHSDDWQYEMRSTSPVIIETILDSCGDHREGAWRDWVHLLNSVGPLACAEACVRGFSDVSWNDGFGGPAWASIARLARDYLKGKVNAEIFMNMAWSLQHNGGNMFNKVWSWSACRRLQEQLEVQAVDEYGMLVGTATAEPAALWRQRATRAARVFDGGYSRIAEFHAGRDSVWLGVQQTDEEVVW